MPAWDVDSNGGGEVYEPERNRVYFNGHLVPNQYLIGDNNIWAMNSFQIPVDWVVFPEPAAEGGTVTAALNRVTIEIDTANPPEDVVWCTAIDWAALTLETAPRPVLGVHGILSKGAVWNSVWKAQLEDRGIAFDSIDLGKLDGIIANANKIENKVAAMRNQYGVEQIDIVSHSKGGIDSRHFVSRQPNPWVKHLLMLGTPNAGSPLADSIQAAVPSLLRNMANDLAGPAGIELTTGHMANYNATHALNSSVDYRVVAGDYDPQMDRFEHLNALQCTLNAACHQAKLDKTWLGISGIPGDTIVPVHSVYANMFDGVTHHSEGADRSATHTGIEHSLAVFNEAVPGLFPLKSGNADASVLAKAGTAGPVETRSFAVDLDAGEAATHTAYVDESVPASFIVYSSDDIGKIELTTPSGVVLSPDNYTAAPSETGDITYLDNEDFLGGRMSGYALEAPVAGAWTVTVTNTPAQDISYILNTTLYGAEPILSQPSGWKVVSRNDTLTLTAKLADDQGPLSSAGIIVRYLVSGDTTVTELNMTEDPVDPGTFTVDINDTSTAGMQPITFVAEGTRRDGKHFTRELFGIFTVSESSVSVTGITDEGKDTNGDSLYEQLLIRLDIDVTDASANDYVIFGQLADSDGNTHEAQNSVALDNGNNAVELAFDGVPIYENGVDGPYTLTILRIAEEDASGPLLVFDLDTSPETASYGFQQFQHALLGYNGNSDFEAVDEDNDGKFDRLDVTIGLDVGEPGYYTWSGFLYDSAGNVIGFASGSQMLGTGPNDIMFEFDGEQIGQSGANGPYYLRDILLDGPVSESFDGVEIPVGENLRAEQFEGFQKKPQPDNVTPVPANQWWALVVLSLMLMLWGGRNIFTGLRSH